MLGRVAYYPNTPAWGRIEDTVITKPCDGTMHGEQRHSCFGGECTQDRQAPLPSCPQSLEIRSQETDGFFFATLPASSCSHIFVILLHAHVLFNVSAVPGKTVVHIENAEDVQAIGCGVKEPDAFFTGPHTSRGKVVG